MGKMNVFSRSILLLAVIMLIACDSKEDGGDGLTASPLTVTPDKTQYYPFDVVTLQLSASATGEKENALQAAVADYHSKVKHWPDMSLPFPLR